MIRLDNDPKRDMTDRAIVKAIRNLELANLPMLNQIHILNHWQ